MLNSRRNHRFQSCQATYSLLPSRTKFPHRRHNLLVGADMSATKNPRRLPLLRIPKVNLGHSSGKTKKGD